MRRRSAARAARSRLPASAAEQHQPAAGGPLGKRDDPQQRRLAGAAAAGEHIEPAAVQRQRYIGKDRRTGAIPLADMLQPHHGGVRGGSCRPHSRAPPIRCAAFRGAGSEILDPGTQLDLPGPGAAVLAMQLQIGLERSHPGRATRRGPFPARAGRRAGRSRRRSRHGRHGCSAAAIRARGFARGRAARTCPSRTRTSGGSP